MEYAIVVLYVVDLFLCVSPPEVARPEELLRLLSFYHLGDDEVLPQSSDVTAKRWGIEVIDESISHSYIVEIYLRTFHDLIPEISGETRKCEYDKRFFEESNIFLYGYDTHTEGSCELGI